MNPPIFNLEIQNFFFVQPSENQAQVTWFGLNIYDYVSWFPAKKLVYLNSKQCTYIPIYLFSGPYNFKM